MMAATARDITLSHTSFKARRKDDTMGWLCSFIVTRVLRRGRELHQRGCGDEGRVWSDGPGAKEHDDFWKL